MMIYHNHIIYNKEGTFVSTKLDFQTEEFNMYYNL